MSILKNIKKKIRRMRRRIAKIIEPSGFDQDPLWDIPVELGLKTASALRKCLNADEQMYRTVAGSSMA
jgi:hypothetical protein